jgi:hypothetical protein
MRHGRTSDENRHDQLVLLQSGSNFSSDEIAVIIETTMAVRIGGREPLAANHHQYDGRRRERIEVRL